MGRTHRAPSPTESAARSGTRPSPSALVASSRLVASRRFAATSGRRNSRSCTLLSSSIFSRICATFVGSRYSGLTHRARWRRSSSSGPNGSSSSSSAASSSSGVFSGAFPFDSASAFAAAFITAATADGNGVKSEMSSSAPRSPRRRSCERVAFSLPSGGAAAWYHPEMLSRGLSAANTSWTL